MNVTVSDKKWFDGFIVELRLRDVLGRDRLEMPREGLLLGND